MIGTGILRRFSGLGPENLHDLSVRGPAVPGPAALSPGTESLRADCGRFEIVGLGGLNGLLLSGSRPKKVGGFATPSPSLVFNKV